MHVFFFGTVLTRVSTHVGARVGRNHGVYAKRRRGFLFLWQLDISKDSLILTPQGMEAFHRDDPELEALREFGRDDSE